MFSLYITDLFITLLIFCPADTKWNVSTGTHINWTGNEIIDSFYILSVHVGWKTEIPEIEFFKWSCIAEDKAIAPPKS